MAKPLSDAAVTVTEVSFPSKSGVATIYGTIWMPAACGAAVGGASASGASAAGDAAPADRPYRGIVQLVHGMMEHIACYDDVARFLVAQGFVVGGNDHIGHGRSVNDPSEWGDMPLKTGMDALIEDAHTMRGVLQERFGADVPYVILGHSMGSFVVRSYVARHGAGLSGAIVCATAHAPAWRTKSGNALVRSIAKMRGNEYRSSFVQNLVEGSYSEAIPNARTPFDWLNTVEECVDAYMADESCGVMFSVGGYAALVSLMVDNTDERMIARIPADLPLLFIAGGDDPVGDNGKGVRKAASLYQKAGKMVQVNIYPGARHDILDEYCKERVRADVVAWFDEMCADAAR